MKIFLYNWYLQDWWTLKDFINCKILRKHKWNKTISNLTFRDCDICGRQEIREPIPPDDELTDWRKNYE